MRLAYLTTQYPSVSHTFIRREVLEIERRGHTVLRLAIRPAGAELVDPADQEEQRKTIHCLSQPWTSLLLAQILTIVGRPLAFGRAVLLAVRMGWRSDRGLLRHIAYLSEAAYFFQVLRKNAIDHVHVHFGTNSAAVARLIRRLGGPPYSFTVHGIDLFDAPRMLDIKGKVADASFVVAVCDFTAAQLLRWIALEDWPKVHVVRCAVGPEFLDGDSRIDAASRNLVCVGRLSPEKGQVLLIEALARLIRSGKDARLILVGDGELRPVIEKRVRELRLGDHVEITGYVGESEVRRRILSGRAFVLPSFAEGLPVVIMEAFALGRPVISTYVAGIPELVRPGENGWLVPAGNVEALASAMREALHTSAEKLDAMAKAGGDRVRSCHCTLTEGARLASLFERAAAQPGGGGFR